MTWMEGLTRAGAVTASELDIPPPLPPAGRERHAYGDGPFARLEMPALPDGPGLYVWALGDTALYVGHTETSLRDRLGSRGFSSISPSATYKAQGNRTNAGQPTMCRVNALANRELRRGERLTLWYRTTSRPGASVAKAEFMRDHGRPAWNRQG